MKKISSFFIFFCSLVVFSQVNKIEPSNWWVGMHNTKLQLLVHHPSIGNAIPSISHKGVEIERIKKGDSPNYLCIDLNIDSATDSGEINIVFNFEDGSVIDQPYELKSRIRKGVDYKGFDTSDVIYLITPDRFSNGDTSNDVFEYLNEKNIDRSNDYGRHGGDIRGIINHIDYIDEMGFTAVWPTPVLTNDMSNSSYHGYAMTDFYEVDPRFGTLDEYIELSTELNQRGLKLIMDQVANHIGSEHWWMKDLPFKNWVNQQAEFESNKTVKKSNHRRTTNQDIYASQIDKKEMSQGWFVSMMPDLNQKNPFLATYLIQNSIWWVETLNLGGIRQDTYPYSDKKFMSTWAGAIMNEYPNFSIVGEEWSTNPLLVGYWQQGARNKDGYVSNLTSTMDFPMQKNSVDALNEKETWDTGFVKMYEGLANDFAYANPEKMMIFPDNHDMGRIFTQLNEDVINTKMALSYMLLLPRIPQLYYGTEILMENTAKPTDHGLIRSDFPGGWKKDPINAFTGKGLSDKQKDMQSFVKSLLNYRKGSNAITKGETIHFAPENKVYTLFRVFKDEVVMLILNKNDVSVKLDLNRFDELNLKGSQFENIISKELFTWDNELVLKSKGVLILTTKIN